MYNYLAKKNCLLALLFFLTNAVTAKELKGKLTGVVYDDANKPLSGITVALEPDMRRAVTDKKGAFEIDGLYAGTYTLKISAIGFGTHMEEVLVEEGKGNTVTIRLTRKNESLNEVKVNGVHGNPDNFIDMTRTAMPGTVITRREIEQMGSRRLDEVLKEQTGLAIVNDIGAGNRAVGLQMQGFDSGYTMIMIDGQPMVGRNSGNLDLSRITVSNIERIEIIKGASACLFGSEALAGVINIVTRKNISAPQAMAALRYGSFNMLDATLEGESPLAGKKGSVYLSGNYYRTDGFNSNPYLKEGKTAPPFDSYAFQGRGRYELNEISSLNFNARYAGRNSTNNQSFGVQPTKDFMEEHDLNGSVALNNNFRNGTRLKTQYYLTRYQTWQDVTDVNTGTVMQGSRFKQYLHRAEVQGIHQFFNTVTLTGGAGGAYELLDNAYYRGKKDMVNYFVYGQADWQLSRHLNVTAGSRYDYHNKYGAKLSPAIGIRYQPLPALTFRAAIGTGFKTPNFQQLYMVFTNVQTGYTVFGAEEFARELKVLQDAGKIISVYPAAAQIGQLRPERSISYSGGFVFNPLSSVKLDVNVFYNDMRNFINSEAVAQQTNTQQVFTYVNVAKAYTAGTEIGLSWKANQALNFSAGYQLLYAVDKGVVDSIKNGRGLYAGIYDGVTQPRRSTRADYFGLSNRSRHMANVKVSYEHVKTGITGSFRVNYRSKYGFTERNQSNLFIDQYDTFVPAYFLFNVALQKTFYHKHLQLQLTADNLMNYRDQLMPGQQGRAIMAGLSWRFFKD